MAFQYSKVLWKDSSECLLRSLDRKDALEAVEHIRQTSGETKYLPRYEDEVDSSVEQEADFLERVRKSKGGLIIGAFPGGRPAGRAGIHPAAPYRKCRYRAEMEILVREAFFGKGIGFRLLRILTQQARKAGFEQVELEVVSENERALSLYQKMGFRIYGTREKTFKYKDGRYGTQFLMLLNDSDCVPKAGEGKYD